MAEPGAPLSIYEGALFRRRQGLVYLAIWMLLATTLLGWIMQSPYTASQALKHAPGFFVPLGLLGMASILIPFAASFYRRRWTVFADRIEISERPSLRIFGFARQAVVPLRDIAMVQLAEAPGELSEFDLRTHGSRLYRIAAARIRDGKQSQIDEAGFAAFVSSIEAALAAAGLPRPQGSMRLTVFDTLPGLVCITAIAALCAVAVIVGLALGVARMRVDAIAMSAMMALTGLTAWSVLQDRRRARRARLASRPRRGIP